MPFLKKINPSPSCLNASSCPLVTVASCAMVGRDQRFEETMKIQLTENEILGLRTVNDDLTSYNGFKNPELGMVECPDFNTEKRCGNGLHFLPWGNGNWDLLNKSKWQIVKVDKRSVIDIDSQKSKAPKLEILYTGGMAEAVCAVLTHPQRPIDQASSGDSSKAASSGNYSTAASSGGDTIAMAAGLNSFVKAGKKGCFATAYYDKKSKRNKIVVGYVGKNKIKPDTFYKLNDNGKYIEVKQLKKFFTENVKNL